MKRDKRIREYFSDIIPSMVDEASQRKLNVRQQKLFARTMKYLQFQEQMEQHALAELLKEREKKQENVKTRRQKMIDNLRARQSIRNEIHKKGIADWAKNQKKKMKMLSKDLIFEKECYERRKIKGLKVFTEQAADLSCQMENCGIRPKASQMGEKPMEETLRASVPVIDEVELKKGDTVEAPNATNGIAVQFSKSDRKNRTDPALWFKIASTNAAFASKQKLISSVANVSEVEKVNENDKTEGRLARSQLFRRTIEKLNSKILNTSAQKQSCPKETVKIKGITLRLDEFLMENVTKTYFDVIDKKQVCRDELWDSFMTELVSKSNSPFEQLFNSFRSDLKRYEEVYSIMDKFAEDHSMRSETETDGNDATITLFLENIFQNVAKCVRLHTPPVAPRVFLLFLSVVTSQHCPENVENGYVSQLLSVGGSKLSWLWLKNQSIEEESPPPVHMTIVTFENNSKLIHSDAINWFKDNYLALKVCSCIDLYAQAEYIISTCENEELATEVRETLSPNDELHNVPRKDQELLNERILVLLSVASKMLSEEQKNKSATQQMRHVNAVIKLLYCDQFLEFLSYQIRVLDVPGCVVILGFTKQLNHEQIMQIHPGLKISFLTICIKDEPWTPETDSDSYLLVKSQSFATGGVAEDGKIEATSEVYTVCNSFVKCNLNDRLKDVSSLHNTSGATTLLVSLLHAADPLAVADIEILEITSHWATKTENTLFIAAFHELVESWLNTIEKILKLEMKFLFKKPLQDLQERVVHEMTAKHLSPISALQKSIDSFMSNKHLSTKSHLVLEKLENQRNGLIHELNLFKNSSTEMLMSSMVGLALEIEDLVKRQRETIKNSCRLDLKGKAQNATFCAMQGCFRSFQTEIKFFTQLAASLAKHVDYMSAEIKAAMEFGLRICKELDTMSETCPERFRQTILRSFICYLQVDIDPEEASTIALAQNKHYHSLAIIEFGNSSAELLTGIDQLCKYHIRSFIVEIEDLVREKNQFLNMVKSESSLCFSKAMLEFQSIVNSYINNVELLMK